MPHRSIYSCFRGIQIISNNIYRLLSIAAAPKNGAIFGHFLPWPGLEYHVFVGDPGLGAEEHRRGLCGACHLRRTGGTSHRWLLVVVVVAVAVGVCCCCCCCCCWFTYFLDLISFLMLILRYIFSHPEIDRILEIFNSTLQKEVDIVRTISAFFFPLFPPVNPWSRDTPGRLERHWKIKNRYTDILSSNKWMEYSEKAQLGMLPPHISTLIWLFNLQSWKAMIAYLKFLHSSWISHFQVLVKCTRLCLCFPFSTEFVDGKRPPRARIQNTYSIIDHHLYIQYGIIHIFSEFYLDFSQFGPDDLAMKNGRNRWLFRRLMISSRCPPSSPPLSVKTSQLCWPRSTFNIFVKGKLAEKQLEPFKIDYITHLIQSWTKHRVPWWNTLL